MAGDADRRVQERVEGQADSCLIAAPYAIGVDIGGTRIKLAAVSASGERRHCTEAATMDGSDVAWAQTISRLAAEAEAAIGYRPIGLGVAAPGLAAVDERSIAWMQGRMPAVQGLDWSRCLGAEAGVPVLNDAHAATIGEAWIGAAAGCANVLLLTLGTGVGGGAIVDGKPIRGAIGRAGHVGHICLDPDAPPDITGTPGSLEDAIGECTLAARTGGRFTSTRALLGAAERGDADAVAVWQRSVYLLACGLVSLVNVLDPEIIVLGGGVANAGAALFGPLERHLERLEWRPTGSRARVAPALLGEYAGACGAAKRALERQAPGAVSAAPSRRDRQDDPAQEGETVRDAGVRLAGGSRPYPGSPS